MEWILETIAARNGVTLSEQQVVTDLDFADDVTLLDESTTVLTTFLHQLEEVSQKVPPGPACILAKDEAAEHGSRTRLMGQGVSGTSYRVHVPG